MRAILVEWVGDKCGEVARLGDPEPFGGLSPSRRLALISAAGVMKDAGDGPALWRSRTGARAEGQPRINVVTR